MTASIPLIGVLLQATGAIYLVNSARQLTNGVGKTIGKHWGHMFPGFFPVLQLLLYVRGRSAAGANLREAVRKGLVMYMVQSVAFFFAYTPLAAGVHHSAPAPDSEEAQELRKGPHPRNTYCWMEHQPGAQLDFAAHQLAAVTDHTVWFKSLPAFLRDW